MPIEARASTAYFACSVLQRALTLITLPLFSRMLTKVEYGQATIYSSWEAMLAVFVTLNLGYGSFATAMVRFDDRRRKYLASVDSLVFALALAFVALYLPFSGLLNRLFELPTWIMLVMVAQIVATSSLQCWYSYNRFEYRYRRVVIVTLITSIAGVVLALFMALALPSGLRGYGRILGTALPGIVMGGTLAFVYIVKEHMLFDAELWGWSLSFNLPLVPYYLSQMLFNQSDRVMISHLSGTENAATYGIAYSLAMVMMFVLNAINGAYVPWFYGCIKDGNMRENRPVSTGIAAVIAALVLLVITCAPEIILVIASEKYIDACWCVGPAAMGLLFHFYSQLFVNVQFYYEEKWLLVIGTALAGVTNVALNWLLIPIFGYITAAYTTLLSFVLMATGNWAMYRILLGKRGLDDTLFDYRALLSIASILLIVGFAMTALYPFPMVRYTVVMTILLFGVLMRGRVIELFRRIKDGNAE